MRKLLFLGVLLLLTGCKAEDSEKEINPFKRLEGHWTKAGATAVVAEHWERLDANRWKGAVYRIADGDSLLLELLEIRPVNDSTYEYVTLVQGQNNGQPVAFRLNEHQSDSLFVFENPNHDFPQKISYHLPQRDSLVIVLGLLADESKNRVFSFGRVLQQD
jgi:hypothetical protein